MTKKKRRKLFFFSSCMFSSNVKVLQSCYLEVTFSLLSLLVLATALPPFLQSPQKKKHRRIDARICRITTPQNARAPPPPDNGATLRHAHRLKCVSAMLAPWKMVVGRRIFEREGRGQLTAVATLENRLEVKRSNPNILTNSLYIVRLKEYQSISVENFVTGGSV